MNDAPIFFEFDQDRSAYLALDTLQELGYKPDFVEGAGKPTLHIHVDKQDLTSALEICQAYGGKLTERAAGLQDEDAYTLAYDIDEGIRIPAHVVTEDFADSYTHPSPVSAEPPESFNPSEETYDGFSPGVHL